MSTENHRGQGRSHSKAGKIGPGHGKGATGGAQEDQRRHQKSYLLSKVFLGTEKRPGFKFYLCSSLQT